MDGTAVVGQNPRVKASSPVLVAALVLVAAVAASLRVSLALADGHLVYPLDDAYIHMAVARNLAEHGVWGVTRHGFTSSTSSLAWPLLLAAAFSVFGAADALPLALNVLAGLACLAVAGAALAPHPAWWRLGILIALVLVTPLPTLVLAGMEHTLHVCVALALAVLVARVVESDGPRRKGALPLALLAALATALRFESLFLCAAAALVLALHRRIALAATVAGAGAIPPLAYAIISIARGWYPLPNSVLLKGARFDLTTSAGIVDLMGGRSLRLLAQTPHLLALVVVCLALLAFAGRTARPTLPALVVIASVLHLQFADTGWLYRYEAYLVALGILAVGVCAPPVLAAVRSATAEGGRLALVAAACLAGVLAYPLVERAVRAAVETPRAAKNIYDQQYQMGLFLRRFYPGAVVAVNDIGAVSYLADVHLLDLYGLASMDVARARRAGTLDHATLTRIAASHGTQVAVVYRSWFSQTLPPDWLEAGSWRAPEKVVVADRVVTFYAVDVPGRDRLIEELRAFESAMPRDVAVRLAGAPEAP